MSSFSVPDVGRDVLWGVRRRFLAASAGGGFTLCWSGRPERSRGLPEEYAGGAGWFDGPHTWWRQRLDAFGRRFVRNERFYTGSSYLFFHSNGVVSLRVVTENRPRLLGDRQGRRPKDRPFSPCVCLSWKGFSPLGRWGLATQTATPDSPACTVLAVSRADYMLMDSR